MEDQRSNSSYDYITDVQSDSSREGTRTEDENNMNAPIINWKNQYLMWITSYTSDYTRSA